MTSSSTAPPSSDASSGSASKSKPSSLQDNGQSVEDIRKGVNIDLQKLESYFSSIQNASIPVAPPFALKQFKLGQSNPTFLLQQANNTDRSVVIRKKPPGALISKTAHAIEREYRILKALMGTKVPVPQVYLLCEDSSILGTPFYAMEFLQGRIFANPGLSSIPQSETRSYYNAIVDTLAEFHKVDIDAVGLSDYGPREGFYARQLVRLSKISESQASVKNKNGDAVGELYRLQDSLKWLQENLVADETTLVHGDYKTDNVVFHSNEPRVIGILDWELSTIGHPLSDLANMLMPWYIPYNPEMDKRAHLFSGFLNAPRPLHVPEAEELIQRYCERVGRAYPIPGWHFCVAFSFLRMAVIAQGIKARLYRDQASSSFAGIIASLAQPCAKILYNATAGKR